MLDLVSSITAAGYAAVVDAASLKRWQRDLFRHRSHMQHVPFVIVEVTAPHDVLRSRVAACHHTGLDASEADGAVLEQQFAQHDPLNDDERSAVLSVDTSHTDLEATLQAAYAGLCAGLVTSTSRVE